MHNHFRCRLDHPSHHVNSASICSVNCLQVYNSHHFRLDDGLYSGLARHLIFEFILQGSPLQTMLVAKEIFLTLQIQQHHHVERQTG
jgi:hypothetical protein